MKQRLALFLMIWLALAAVADAGPAMARQSATSTQKPVSVVLVFFHFNSLRITPAADASLQSIARLHAENPDAPVRIVGILNGSGMETSSRELAIQRVEAVRDRLRSLGVPAHALTTDVEEPRLPAMVGTGRKRPSQRRVEVYLG